MDFDHSLRKKNDKIIKKISLNFEWDALKTQVINHVCYLNSEPSLSSIYPIAAEVLAAAVLELCPDAYLIGRGEIPWGFAYDFLFSKDSFSHEMFPFIEERMGALISQNIPIKKHEMLPGNGADFLHHHHRMFRAEFAKNCTEQLVGILQMGSFIDLYSGPYLKSSGEVPICKLIDCCERTPIGYHGSKKKVVRIRGALHHSSRELKKILKNLKSLQEKDHMIRGEKLGLFSLFPERDKNENEILTCYWRDKGIHLRDKLIQFWKEEHRKGGFELIMSPGKDMKSAHEKFFLFQKTPLINGPFRTAELKWIEGNGSIDADLGFYQSTNRVSDSAYIFCLSEYLLQELISSLKFFEKISKITTFKCSLIVSLPSTDFEIKNALLEASSGWNGPLELKEAKKGGAEMRIEDCFGRVWPYSYLEITKRVNDIVIKRSSLPNLEKMIALVLETGEEGFPNLTV